VLLAAGDAHDAIAPLENSVRLYTQHHLVVSADHADAVAALARARALCAGTSLSTTP
jgi:hypothetical protein